MRCLKHKWFEKDLKRYHLDDQYVCNILDDISAGRAVALGGKIYKIRASRKGHGKSAGFRNIFFWKRDELIILYTIFSKNERDNLTVSELESLKDLSRTYDKLTKKEMDLVIQNNILVEVHDDKKR